MNGFHLRLEKAPAFFPPQVYTLKQKEACHSKRDSKWAGTCSNGWFFPAGVPAQSLQPERHWRWVLMNTFTLPASLAKCDGTPSPRAANQTRPGGSDMSQSQSTLGLSFSFCCSSRAHWQSQHRTLGIHSLGMSFDPWWSFLGFVLQLENSTWWGVIPTNSHSPGIECFLQCS